jgi:hypothetical protein
MILNKVYDTTAKWDKDNNKWNVSKRLKYYQWNDNNNQPVSPEYEDLEQALKWIKEHDESKETNQKVI